MITESNAGLNAGSNPQEVTPGADGDLWFTDRGTTKAIGQITLTDTGWTITNHNLASTLLPGGIRTGPDGNLWFTDNGAPQAIGSVRRGSTGGVIRAPRVEGAGKEGHALHCNKAKWSRWAGRQALAHEVRLRRLPLAARRRCDRRRDVEDVRADGRRRGARLSCSETVTYTLFPTTVMATSASIDVRGHEQE